MSRTIIISPNWIGDAVMAQPLLQRLKQQHPGRAIDVLAPAWVAPVWRAMREVDTVIEAPFRHGKLQLRERWRFAKQLRQRGYADAYVLPNTLKFALIPWLAGIPKRVGYRGEIRHGLINVMHHDDPALPRPMISFYAALAEAPQKSVPPPLELPRPTLVASHAQRDAALAQVELKADRPLLAFAPGAEFGSAKRWPAAHFAELAQRILHASPEAQIVLMGSARDRAVCEEIVAAVPQVHNLAGVTDLSQAIALIAQADAMVSNDSGLLHIASALNRQIIAFYGPTDPDHAPPFSDVFKSLSLRLDCAPCRQRECPLGHHHCMVNMSADMAWAPLKVMMKDAAKGKAGRAKITSR